jgi:membrane protease YdiL (CAAX protease family)
LLYGALVLVCACLPSVSDFILYQVRLLGMFLVCWAPIAVFLAHLPLPEPDTGRALCMAVLKAGLLYYGACAAITGGLRAELLYRFEKQAQVRT